MVTQSKLERLRAFLQTTELTPEERAWFEALLVKAEGGDKDALTRVEQVASERGYQPIPGKDVHLPPGPVMVCPQDPAHYQMFQREVGEILRCPVHHVLLVPPSKPDD